MMRAERTLRVKEHLDLLTSHLENFKEIINCHMVNFLQDKHWTSLIPNSIQGEIQNEADIEMSIARFFNDSPEPSRNEFTEFQKFIDKNRLMAIGIDNLIPPITFTTNELMAELEHLGCARYPAEDLNISEFCNAKKNHEVETISEVIAKLSTYGIEPNAQRMLVIDVGDGKGYLSSRLALQHKIKVLGVDGNAINTENAAKRSQKLGRAWNGLTRRAKDINQGRTPTTKKQRSKTSDFDVVDITTKALSQLNVEESLYRTTTLMIDSSTDLLDLVRRNFPQVEISQFVLTGLHTCGNLSPNSLTIFLNNEHLKVVCNVGCCYHLLRERFVEDIYFNPCKLEDSCKDYGFPMSSFLIEKKFALGRNARMLANQAIYRVVANREIPNECLAYRALLEVLLRNHLPGAVESALVGKIKCESFEDYVHKSLTKLGISSSEVLPDLKGLYSSYEYDCKLLKLFYFIRLSFASVIETTIILDKYLYLLENGIDHAFIVKLFSPVVSPRFYGIVALK